MFSHMTIGSNDLDRSKKFYDSLFTAIGGNEGQADDKGRIWYRHKGMALGLTKPIDGEPASHGNGSTIGFNLDSPEQTDSWHEAGTANGGTSVEDPPGYRDATFGKLYLAYLRDPDGNKLCGLHRPAQ